MAMADMMLARITVAPLPTKIAKIDIEKSPTSNLIFKGRKNKIAKIATEIMVMLYPDNTTI